MCYGPVLASSWHALSGSEYTWAAVLVKSSHSANIACKTLNCKAPWLCDHRQSVTSCQTSRWSVHATLVNLGQHYLRKEILLWKHQPSPLAASSTNTPRAPAGRWGGCGSTERPGSIGEHGTLEGGTETSSGKEDETSPSRVVHYKKHSCSSHCYGWSQTVRGSDCVSDL